MKLTVLIDNNTLIDRYFLGEPGVSYLIETDGKKILFDIGYSDAFIINARKLSIDLQSVNFIVLSHGHLDHTWGLIPLIRLYTEALIEGLHAKKPTLVTHPLTLSSRTYGDLTEAAQYYNIYEHPREEQLRLAREALQIDDEDWTILEHILGSFKWVIFHHPIPDRRSEIRVDVAAMKAGEWTTTYF